MKQLDYKVKVNMRSIEKEIFVCIDCETTGLDPIQDQVIEVAVILFNTKGVLETFETLIDPCMLIPESSIAIHHITNEMVMGKPKIQEVLPDILKMAGNRIIIGHGVHFDVEILALAADRFGIPCSIRNNQQIDTLRLARSYGETPVNSLNELRKHFNIEAEGAHRAMGDVVVNMEVFKYLVKQYRNMEHLFEVLAKPIMIRTMPLGKHKGRLIKELPLDYLLYIASKDFDKDLLYSIRSEINRRKKGNLFSQMSNPFNDL